MIGQNSTASAAKTTETKTLYTQLTLMLIKSKTDEQSARGYPAAQIHTFNDSGAPVLTNKEINVRVRDVNTDKESSMLLKRIL